MIDRAVQPAVSPAPAGGSAGERRPELKTRAPLIVIVVIAALAFAVFNDALRPLLRQTPLAGMPYGVSFALNAASLIVFAVLLGAAKGPAAPSLLRLTGLAAPIGRPLLFALALFAPAAAIAHVAAAPAAQLRLYDLAVLSVIFPVMEEIGFRGFAVGALMRLAGWPLAPAALLPAAFFGAAHFGQGSAPAEIAGIVAITGLGGLLFGWIFARWGFNLWPAIFAHVGLNALWGLYDLGETAIGGLAGNALRVGVILAAIALTLAMNPRPSGRAPPPAIS